MLHVFQKLLQYCLMEFHHVTVFQMVTKLLSYLVYIDTQGVSSQGPFPTVLVASRSLEKASWPFQDIYIYVFLFVEAVQFRCKKSFRHCFTFNHINAREILNHNDRNNEIILALVQITEDAQLCTPFRKTPATQASQKWNIWFKVTNLQLFLFFLFILFIYYFLRKLIVYVWLKWLKPKVDSEKSLVMCLCHMISPRAPSTEEVKGQHPIRRVTISVNCGRGFAGQRPYVVLFLLSQGLKRTLSSSCLQALLL